MHTQIDVFEKPIERIKRACDLMGLSADFERKLSELETRSTIENRPARNMSALWRIQCGARPGNSIRTFPSPAPTSERRLSRSRGCQITFATEI
jgi:hypothetical protein